MKTLILEHENEKSFGTGTKKVCDKIYIGTMSFTAECCEFLDRCFRGLYECECVSDEFKLIHISTDGYAAFTKLIMKKLYGNVLIKISFTVRDHEFRVSYWFDTDCISDKEILLLSEVAARSGFTLKKHKSCLALIAEASPTSHLHIYARSSRAVYYSLERVFLDIPQQTEGQ